MDASCISPSSSRALRVLALAALLLGVGHGEARADIYALGHEAATAATVLRSTETGEDTGYRIANCCAIANGSATFDTLGNRAFFIAQAAGGAELVSFNYLSGAQSRLPLSAPYRITHLEYDPGSGQLLALARDPADERVVMLSLDPLSGQLSLRARLTEPCCELKTGVSVLLPGSPTRLLAVGRSGGEESLLSFDFSAATSPTVVALPANLRVAELAVHPASAQLFGVGFNESTGLTHAIAFGAPPGFVPTLIGAGSSDCCFVLAGSAAIDRLGNSLAVLGQASGGAPRLQRFSLFDGSRSQGIELQAHALLEDFGVRFGGLFADGFE